MVIILLSFLAGVLTILAPCILPVLPIIVGGSVENGKRNTTRPIVITASLAVSVIVFTLLLKYSTTLLALPPRTWPILSGSILLALGLTMLFPRAWDALSGRLTLSRGSEQLLQKQTQRPPSHGRDVLIGAALGPVFSSCSPTYFFILATVLPQRFGIGLLALIAYAIGLSLMLLLIAYLGQAVIARVRWAANPHGWFKKTLGVLFLLIGLFVMTGLDKQVQAWLLDTNYPGLVNFEERLLEAQQ